MQALASTVAVVAAEAPIVSEEQLGDRSLLAEDRMCLLDQDI